MTEKYDVLVSQTFSDFGYEKAKAELDYARYGLVITPEINVRLERRIGCAVLDNVAPVWYRANQKLEKPLRPARQFGLYYCLLRTNPPDSFQWDSDGKLRRCIAFARIVHNCPIGYEYRAYVETKGQNIAAVNPFPGYPTYAVATERPWLLESEWKRVGDMLSKWDGSRAKSLERLSQVQYHLEKVAFENDFDSRWVMIGSVVETLIGHDWTRGRKKNVRRFPRFLMGLARLAREFGMRLFTRDINKVWEMRSRVAHGLRPLPRLRTIGRKTGTGVTVSPATHYAELFVLYKKIDRLVCKAVEKSILDDAFARNFRNNGTVEKWVNS